MVSVITLALMLQASTTPIEPISKPQAPDIQSALSDHWVMISSTGISLSDYIVRNVRCVSAPLDQKYAEPAKDNTLKRVADIAVSQVSCSYEYATIISLKSRLSKPPRIKPKSKQHSQREISRIPEKLWQQGERNFVRISRTSCLYMSRTPNPGECDDYWAVSM